MGNRAIVTKGFVTGAGFLQAMPLGQVLRNSLKQVLVEGAPFDTCHRKPCLAPSALLSRFEFAQGERTHAGIEMNMQLGLRTSLRATQRRKLLGVSEEKLDPGSSPGQVLEARFVDTIKRLRIHGSIGAEQNGSPLAAGVHHQDDTQIAPKMGVVEDLMIEPDRVVFARHTLKA